MDFRGWKEIKGDKIIKCFFSFPR